MPDYYHPTLTLSQKIADFIVKTEFDRQTVLSKGPFIGDHFEKKNLEINKHLKAVTDEITHFRAIMTRAGAEQWQQLIENLSKNSRTEIRLLEKTYAETCQAINKECDHLNHLSMHTVKNVAQLLSQAKAFNLQHLTEKKSLELTRACEKKIDKIKQIINGFRWKNLLMAVILSLIVAVIVSLYINDEWPWQAHEEVIKQREAGEVLLNSWKYLSSADKELILKSN